MEGVFASMSNKLNTETSNVSTMDLIIRVAVGVGAVLFGVLMIMRKSDNPDIFGRYELQYAVLILAYTPLLYSAIVFTFRGGGVVGAIRPVLSLRFFQVGLGLFLLVLTPIIVRYLLSGSLLDVARIIAMCFLLASYVLYVIAIAGRLGLVKLRSILANLAMVMGAVLVTLAVIAGLFTMGTEEVADVVTRDELHALRPLIHEPNAQFVYPGQLGRVREFQTLITNNSFGYNDKERMIENPNNRFRILILGDSYVEAFHVPQGRSFAALLEDLLNEGEDRFEVIPLGRGGIGQKEQRKILQDLGLRFNPHLVILLFVSNDLYDNDPELKAAFRKYLRTWTPAPRSPRALLFPELTLDRFITQRLHTLVARYGYLLDERLSTSTVRPDALALLSPHPPIIQKAFLQTETLLDGIVGDLKARNVKLLLMSRPNKWNKENLISSHPSLRSFDIDVEFLYRWLREYAESRLQSYFNLEQHFEAHIQAGYEPLTWEYDGHWNELGHEVTAKALYRFLLNSHLLN
jgi:hypothetical protein